MIATARLSRYLGLVCLLAAPARAAWQDIPVTDFTMSPPPAPGSADYVADFSTLLRWQSSDRAQSCALAQQEKTPTFTSLYGPCPLLSARETAAVAPFLNKVTDFGYKATAYYKTKFARPRPYDEDPRIHPCADKPGGATSYPSGHASTGALEACVLGRIFPQKAKALADYGKSVGDLRFIVGVHHPSDVVAGQELAAQVCDRLLHEQDFLAELSAVKVAP